MRPVPPSLSTREGKLAEFAQERSPPRLALGASFCAGLGLSATACRPIDQRTALQRCNDDEHSEDTLIIRGHAAADGADEKAAIFRRGMDRFTESVSD
jgi:hypothetical protein